MEDVGIFYRHFVHLKPFGAFLGHFVFPHKFWYIFPRFGTLQPEKSGNPVADPLKQKNVCQLLERILSYKNDS
jgi:hypothetical protein